MSTMSIEEYEAKVQARLERWRAASAKAQAESERTLSDARKMAGVIPFGQPILVGHHSERGDRRYRGRIESKFRKGFELHKKAQYYAQRAAAAEKNDAIMSDDPRAVEKLTRKIALLEEWQETMKAMNKAHAAYLKNPASLDKNDALSEDQKQVIRAYKPAYSWEPHPYPPYALQNNNANIRRCRERLEEVEKKQSLKDEDFTANGVRVEGRPGENRIRLYYGRRVDLDTYKLLRQHGFRPLRSAGEGAFSGYYNNNCRYFVHKYITKKEG